MADRFYVDANQTHNLNDINSWSTSTGGSGGASVPGSGDVAIFDGAGTYGNNACNIDATVNVAGLSVTSGYTNTITQTSTYTVDVGASNLSLVGGTFTGGTGKVTVTGTTTINGTAWTLGAQTVQIQGDWTYTSGTFDATTNNSTLIFRGTTIAISGSVTLKNVTFTTPGLLNGTYNIAGGTTLTVNSTLTITHESSGYAVTINTGDISAKGDITIVNIGAGGGTATLTINGTGNQILTGSGSDGFQLPKVVINKASGDLTLSGTISVSNDWTYTSMGTGSLVTTSSTVVFKAANNSYTTTITGSHTLNNVTFSTAGAQHGTYTIATGTILTVEGTLTITAGATDYYVTINTGDVYAKGDITITNSGYGSGSATITANGTGNQVLTGRASLGGSLPKFTINKASGNLTLVDIITVGNNWTFTSIGTGSLIVTGSTVLFATTSLTVTGTHTLNNITFRGPGANHATYTIAAGTILTAEGTLTIEKSATNYDITLNTGDIYAKGNIVVTCDGFSSGGSATITANGTATQTITGNGTVDLGNICSLIIDKASGNAELAAYLTCTNLTINSSNIFDCKGFSLKVGTTISNNGTLQLLGSETLTFTGGWDSNSGTVLFNGTSSYTMPTGFGGAFYNLQFNGAAGVWDKNTATNCTVGGTLTITNGTFDLNGKNLTVTGATSNLAKLRLQGGETVTFTGGWDSTHGITEFDGSGTYTIPTGFSSAFFSVIFNGSGQWTLIATTTINGYFTLTTGIFIDAGYAVNVASTILFTAGTITLTGDWTQTGDANYTIAATMTTCTLVNCDLDLQGTGNLTLSKQINASPFKTITLAASGKVTTVTDGGPGGEICVKQVNVGAGTLTLSSTLLVGIYTTTPITVHASATINGTANLIFYSYAAVTASIPAMTLTGTTGLNIYVASASALTVNMAGHISVNAGHITFTNLNAGAYTFNTNNYNITMVDGANYNFTYGSQNAAGVATFNLGSSTITCTNAYSAKNATTTINMSTSQWNIRGSWYWATGTTVNVGTSTVTFITPSQGQNVYSRSCPFYKLEINTTNSAYIVYLQDALTCTNVNLTTGTLQTGNFAVTIAGIATWTAGVLTLGSSAVTAKGNWIFSSSATLTVTANTSTVTFTTNSASITNAGQHFKNVVFNQSTKLWTNQDAMIIDGTCTITSGTLQCNGYALTVTEVISNNAILRLQGGETVTFTAGWDSTHGQVQFDGTGTYNIPSGFGSAFNNLWLRGTGQWTLTATTTVNGNFLQNSGGACTLVTANNSLSIAGTTTFTTGTVTFGSSAITARGNWSFAAAVTVTANTSVVTFNTNNASITSNGKLFYGIVIDDDAGGIRDYTLADALLCTNLTITEGELIQNAFAITSTGTFLVNGGTFTGNLGAINTAVVTISSGAFTSTANTLTVTGNFTFSGGSYTHSSGLIKLTTTSGSTMNANGINLYNMEVDVGASWQTKTIAANNTINVLNNLTLTSASGLNAAASDDTSIIRVQGNVSIAAFGAADASHNDAIIEFYGTNAQSITISSTSHIFPQLQINKSSNTVTLTNTYPFKVFNMINRISGTFDATTNSTDITIYGGYAKLKGTLSLYKLQCSLPSWGTCTLTDTTTVNNDLILLEGYGFDAGTAGLIDIKGNITVTNWGSSSAFNDGHIRLSGSAAQVVSIGAGAGGVGGTGFGELEINKTNATDTVELTGSGTLITFYATLDITKGIFDINGKNITVTGGYVCANNGALRLQGGETVIFTSGFDTDSGTVVFDGVSTYTMPSGFGDAFYNLSLTGNGVSLTFRDANLTVNNAFTANLTGATFTYYGGRTHAVNTWYVNGSVGNRIKLRRAGTGTYALNVTTQTGNLSNYVDILDCNASGGIRLFASVNSIDRGFNNSNWSFGGLYFIDTSYENECVADGNTQKVYV